MIRKQNIQVAIATLVACIILGFISGPAQAGGARHLPAFKVGSFFLNDPYLNYGFFSSTSFLFQQHRYYNRGYRYGTPYDYNSYASPQGDYLVLSDYEQTEPSDDPVDSLSRSFEQPERAYIGPTYESSLERGRRYEKAGHSRSAQYFYSRAEARTPLAKTSVARQADKVFALFSTGQFDQAAQKLRTRLEVNPSGVIASDRLYRNLRPHQAPLAALRRRIMSDDRDINARLLLGYIYRMANRPMAAQKQFAAAQKIEPDDEHAAMLLKAIPSEL